MLEHKDKPSGPTSYRELTLQVMPFKMDKEILWLIHGPNLSLPPETTTSPITTNTLLFWTLYTKEALLKPKKMLPKKNWRELLPTTKILITPSTVNLLLIYNKPEQAETILQLLLTPKLSTGEEMTPFKREILPLEETTVGHLLITLTGTSPEPITWLLTKMLPLSDKTQFPMLDQIYIWKTNRLTMEVMLGDRLKEKMLLPTRL